MPEYKFCPYCGHTLEGAETTCWGDVECIECGEVVVESDRTKMERIQYQEEMLEELEERQEKSGFYAFQDTLEMYRRER